MYYDVITVKFDWLRGHDYVTIPVYVCWSLWPRISDEGHEVKTLCYSCYFTSALDYSPRTGSLEKQTSCCQVPSPLLCYWEVEGHYYIAIVAIHAEVWINFAGTCARPNMQVITGKDSSLHYTVQGTSPGIVPHVIALGFQWRVTHLFQFLSPCSSYNCLDYTILHC